MLTAYKKMIPNHEHIKNPIVLIFVLKKKEKHTYMHVCVPVYVCFIEN